MSFARRIAQWQRSHGRHDLPWQKRGDAYRVWISEIMLQQTQVATVIPYFERFIARFPDVAALAAAELDHVLAHWSGLGYYSRARHLHRAAREMRERHGGRVPADFDALTALPGIGRSTAGAIMVFAHGGRYPILDGNVKRVLARAFGIAGHAGEKRVSDALWRTAEHVLPASDLEAYTQGLMDLGALVCVRRRPACDACPVACECIAQREQRQAAIPAPRPRPTLPHRSTVMLVLQHRDRILLEKRPAPGIWGGLWCFPEVAAQEDVCAHTHLLGVEVREAERLPDVRHGFTHFTLTISPQRLEVTRIAPVAAERDRQWLPIVEAKAVAIPAPVRRILDTLSA